MSAPLGWRVERCDVCEGSGVEPGGWPYPCEACHGQGEIPVPLHIPPIAWLGIAVMLLSIALLYHSLFEGN